MKEIKKPVVKPYLLTRKLEPENQEMPVHFIRQWVIPGEYFYRRNHLPYPDFSEDFFELKIEGEVMHPAVFKYEDIIKLPSKTLLLPLECSGNKRAYFNPKAYGDQWRDGAITQGIWRGVPLRDIFSTIGIKNSALEVVFTGWDFGKKPGILEPVHFARSLPIEKAFDEDIIIAYEYNGKPIPFEHGYPLRLIVPGWYAMASVKWLKVISVINYKFTGPFQAEDYVYYPHKDSDKDRRPVTVMHVNSTIQRPLNYEILDRGTHNIDGIAWTGDGKIEKVEVSIDGGGTWKEAVLFRQEDEPYSWTFWTYKWAAKDKGEYTIISRAWDSEGKVQPVEAEWNRKGYGYNAVFTVKVKIV